jgi:hypothetical protein
MKSSPCFLHQTAWVLCVLAGALTGCAHRANDVQVRVVSRAHADLKVPHSFFVDRTGESPFGKREHDRLCVRLERALEQQGWRLESEKRAGYRVRCAWTDVEWQRVHRAPRVPMTRYWYLGSVYDPQGPSYALPGKTGMYRARQSMLSVELGHPGGSAQYQQPERSAMLVQSGGQVGEESLARLVRVLLEGGPAPVAPR